MAIFSEKTAKNFRKTAIIFRKMAIFLRYSIQMASLLNTNGIVI